MAQLLIRKGVLSKQDVLDLYSELVTAKAAKGELHSSAAETEAAELLSYLRSRLD